MDLLVVVVNVACWSTVVVLWIATAIRDSRGRPSARVDGSTDLKLSVGAFVAVAVIILVGRRLLAPLSFDAVWVRLIGAAILVGSTVFAVAARLALGRSWSLAPRAVIEDGLRTEGPYAITRHPIYTGLLGMLLGSAVLGGLGQWLVLPAAALVVIEVKIRSEERLLLETFPETYRAYRARVPRLIPGWRTVGWRRDPQ
jgi:protein-S-isoprenylcysteine O-methyltransferase Ste14